MFGLPAMKRRSHAFPQNCLKWLLQALKSLGKGAGITVECCEADLAGRMQPAGSPALATSVRGDGGSDRGAAAVLSVCRECLGQWALHRNSAHSWDLAF